MREDLRIGSVAGPGPTLTSVGSVAIGPGGDLFVAQPNEAVIRVFDAGGAPVRTIGRSGDGPGEFSRPGALGFLGDTLYVSDVEQMRVSFFSEKGDLRGTAAISSPALSGGHYPAPPYLFLRDGTGRAVVSPPFRPGSVPGYPYLLIDRGGEVLDTLAWQDLDGFLMAFRHPDGWGTSSPQPFADASIVLVDPWRTEVVLVDRTAAERPEDADFLVVRRTFAGDTIRLTRHSYVPTPIPVAVMDSVVGAISDRQAVRSIHTDPARARSAVIAALRTTGYYPPLSTARLAEDGSVWLGLERRDRIEREWRVVDPEGNESAYLLPVGFDLKWARGGTVWGVETDDLGVPYLVRYGAP